MNLFFEKIRSLPPRKLRKITGSKTKKEFLAVGLEYLDYLKELADLKSDSSVLDIGCGCGRMALLLAEYLTESGNYCGLDVDRKSVEWCRKNIAVQQNNFSFFAADIYNQVYNPLGEIDDSQYRFPFVENSFDVIFAASLFTHLKPKAVENYLNEVKKVLKKEGKFLASYFLLNPTSIARIDQGLSHLPLKVVFDGNSMVWRSDKPEAAIAYDQNFIKQLYFQNGLRVEKIFSGKWSGDKNGRSFQDIIVAIRPR